MKKILFIFAVVFFTLSVFGFKASAYVIPSQDTKARAFYVFGSEGNTLAGAEDNVMEIVIDVPSSELSNVIIEVYDPDTGNFFDWREPIYEVNFKPSLNEWNTTCEFEFYGRELLDSVRLNFSRELDRKWYRFGPYDKTQGKEVDGYYRFRLVATGISGNDQNLFRVRISPESAQSHSEKIKIRLHPKEGKEMFFYPQIPAGTRNVIVENYDLDLDGGTSRLASDTRKRGYSVNGSESGQWSQTVVPVYSTGGSMVYTIKKGTQKHANAAIRMLTDKGETIPIYFRKSPYRTVKKVEAIVKPKPVPVKPKPAPKLVVEKKAQCNKFTFDATKSYDLDKQELNFLWNFGDGTTSTEPITTHIYEKGGEYTVTLTVSNNSGLPCDTSTTSQNISVNTPPIADFSSPDLVCLSDTVYFDASSTFDDNPKKLTYSWNFGDGSRSQGKKVSHVYSKGGTYNVTLTVNDHSDTICDIDTIKKVVKVNTPPTARAGSNINRCLESLNEEYIVFLDGSRSKNPDGDTLSYAWNLGDGTILLGEKIKHIYETSGIYTVTLIVDDGIGLACSKASDTIIVNLNKPPVASAGNDRKACVGETVSFDGSDSKAEPGEKLSYKWNFGDGNESSGIRVNHTYEKGGKYPVTLAVNDNMDTACSTDMDTAFLRINSKPSAIITKVNDNCVDKEVYFNASGSNDPDGDTLSYTWNFGDGITEKVTSSKVVHTYKTGGSYVISVTIDDGSETACSSASDSSKIKINTPPVVKLNMIKLCCVDMEQKFDASQSFDTDRDTLSHTWYLGDGTHAKGAKISHAYTKPGTYRVILEVNDGSGTECSSNSITEIIKVHGNPVPIIEIR
ncbi:MAG: PKD domain-containing protein [Candidatus Saelkia tenebricola]|nr:PKD domain-containing protein [Candidatus Saelkia tenebricola]